MRIGYSFWGFLGPGVTDTPDGGRSHRRVLLDGLCSLGHELVLLQANRDLTEAGLDLTHHYQWDPAGFPQLDVLMLEWRWPIPGRNTTPCTSPGHTCDLHRQTALLEHYTRTRPPTRILLWDKDLQLPLADPIRRHPSVQVLEAALWPRQQAARLLFPIADHALDAAIEQTQTLATRPRDLSLVYIGNQYDRDTPFNAFFAPAARQVQHVVAGKWPHRQRWPQVQFIGRIPFPEVGELYGRAVATVLLLPARYQTAGQMTQRLAEALLAGCLPITPTTIRDAATFSPTILHASNGDQVTAVLARLRAQAAAPAHADLLARCLGRLDRFRLSRQLATLTELLHQPPPTAPPR